MNYLIVKEGRKAVIYKNGIKMWGKYFTSMKKATAWLNDTDADYRAFVASNILKLQSYK